MPLTNITGQSKENTSLGRILDRALTRQGVGLNRRAVVIGTPGDVPRALEHASPGGGTIDVVAVLAIDVESEEGQEGLKRLTQLIADHEADTILVAGPIGPSTMRRVADLAILHECQVLAVMPTEVLPDHQPVIIRHGPVPLVQLSGIPRRGFEAAAKRTFDVVAACLGLVVAAPIMFVLGALIRLESPGGIIFRHERIGLGGRRFSCLKLRTMHIDAEAQLQQNNELYEEYRRNHFKIPDDRDPRVTRIGRFLRRTSLDELPQLWNVLVGDMSVVGPRPVVEDELRVYGPSQDLLTSVRPGLTGAWAVSGRHAVGYPERCVIELDYVRRWTLARDMGIVVATARMLTRPSA